MTRQLLPYIPAIPGAYRRAGGTLTVDIGATPGTPGTVDLALYGAAPERATLDDAPLEPLIFRAMEGGALARFDGARPRTVTLRLPARGVHLDIVVSDLRLRSHGKRRTLRCQTRARSSAAATHTRPQSARGLPCDRSRRPVRPVLAASHHFEVRPGARLMLAIRDGAC